MLYASFAIALSIEALAWDFIKGNGPVDDFEHAAFIIRGPNGELALINWTEEHLFRQARWSGRMPENVIAVVHTHPLSMPRPSLLDIGEAKRIGLPFYVVTRVSLCRADPDGSVTCSSTKPRPKLRRVAPAADDRLALALQMNAK